jgi:tape measure domain-containing protein
MIGDQEKANKIIHALDYSPVSDFYGTAKAIGGLQSMVTFGMQAEEASDVLTRIGDIAQGDTEAFSSMSNAMGQIFAKGKADSNNLKALVMQGFDVVGEVAKQSGKSREEIQKSGVSYEQTAAALKALTSAGGKYEGMLAKQMNTLGGVIKQFQSLKAATAEAIGIGISDELKELLKYILEIGRAGQEAFVGKFVSAIKVVIHWIFQIIIMWKVLCFRIADMGDALAPVKQFFSDLRDAAGTALTGIMKLVMAVAPVFLQAFKTIYAFVGPVIKELGTLVRKVSEFIAEGVQGAMPILMMLEGPFVLIGSVLGTIIKGLGGVIDFLKPIAPLIGSIAAIIGVWTAAQWLLNAAMMANPIGLIVAAVIAAVALIVGLVMVIKEHWGEIGEFFSGLWGGIKDVSLATWDAITRAFIATIGVLKAAWTAVLGFFQKIGSVIAGFFIKMWETIVGFFKKYGEIILQVLAVLIFGIPGLIAVAVRQIIKHWDVIGPALKKIFDKVAAFFVAFGKKAAEIFRAIVDKIKTVFAPVADFFSVLWEGIISVAINVWNTLKGWFSGLIENIKSIWSGITGFFSGLWEAIKQSPASAIEYIKNAFFGLFDAIQQKMFGFINKIKEGWEGVKGLFGNAINGVVNFFTGGDESLQKGAPTKVNDMILTPEGKYETSPGDYIMAMKDPAAILDSLLRFFGPGMGQTQPAYAGMPNYSPVENAMAREVGSVPRNYNTTNSNSNYSESVQAPITVNVNASGMTVTEAKYAVQRGVQDALEGAVNSSRADIPSPEVRRH